MVLAPFQFLIDGDDCQARLEWGWGWEWGGGAHVPNLGASTLEAYRV